MLEVVWVPFAGLLGQLPAILALDGAQQPLQIGHRTLVRLGPGKAWPHLGRHLWQASGPPGYLRLDHGQGQRHDSSYGLVLTHGMSSFVVTMVQGT
jgi:hypothetical protein